MLFSRKPPDAVEDIITTLPTSALHEVFGKVSYRKLSGQVEVMFTVLVPSLEGQWQTGVALDASDSLKSAYGRVLADSIPRRVKARYRKQGWIREEVRDGETVPIYEPEAYNDAIASGYLQWTTNEVEPKAREFLEYLAANLDLDGGTTLIYWACGEGSQIEVVGDITAPECAALVITGPAEVPFGASTRLTPALRYFEQRFADAPNGMYVFVTDGDLDDLDEVKQYTTRLAQEIEAGTRNPLKCVLVGLGEEINEAQMTQLDDLDTGTDIDIWDHKIAGDMRSLLDIFAELVDETRIVAPSGSIYDADGNVVAQFPEGLPGRVVFRMPDMSTSFTLEAPALAEEGRITQSLLLPGKDSL